MLNDRSYKVGRRWAEEDSTISAEFLASPGWRNYVHEGVSDPVSWWHGVNDAKPITTEEAEQWVRTALPFTLPKGTAVKVFRVYGGYGMEIIPKTLTLGGGIWTAVVVTA